MHREFSPTESPLRPPSAMGTYALTALCTALLLVDLSPYFGFLFTAPSAPPTFLGFRFALWAAVLGGARSLFSGLEKLLEGKLSADLAIAIACIAAIWLNEPLVAAEVVVIGLVGECLEAWTFGRAKRSLAGLAELFPQRCWVLRDGVETRTLTTDVLVNDVVVVKPGGKLPADGVVTAGQSTVDQAALTGESLPVDKGPGDFVLAGSVNQLGTLTYTVTKVAKDTAAGRVIELTVTALQNKAPLERTADRLAKYFLPVVLALALITFAYHYFFPQTLPEGRNLTKASTARLALYPALAVLVVACPCPLVLATPTAILAALARLRGTGILPKGGAALERLAGIQSIAFDKTGTLTFGQPEVAEVYPFQHFTKDDVLKYAAMAEAKSEHPLARAIIAAFNANVILPQDFQAIPGGGVKASIDNATVYVGTVRMLQAQGIAITDTVTATLKTMDEAGQTAVLVAKESEIVGAIGLVDRVRPEALGVLQDIKQMGISPIMVITGDRSAAAFAVLTGLPVDTIHADCLPEDKAKLVTSSSMAYVGDGLNDAPALARAGVGLAVAGTDVAAEAGDVVLMGPPLKHLPFLLRLSRETVRVIQQNINWFGFGVNLLGVLLAGWLWPLFANTNDAYDKAPLVGVIYHQLGSFLVLLNSLRLLGFERSANPVFQGVHSSARNLDRWLNTLHPEDLWHWAEHNARKLILACVSLGVLAWLLSGLTVVAADEVAVVKRFGGIRTTLPPGLHIRWPWPVEEPFRFKPAEPRTVPVGYRPLTAERQAQRDDARQVQQQLRNESTWASAHSADTAKVSDESTMLTGDGNLLEVQATVRYRIANAALYLSTATDADTIIRSATEAVLRERVAAQSLSELLTTGRVALETDTLLQVNKRLAMGLDTGVVVDGITVHDLHPPPSVVAAYHAVAEAIQNKDRAILEAKAEALRMEQRSKEVALKLVRNAEAEAIRKVKDAEAARDSFLAWIKNRSDGTGKQLTEFRLALAAVTTAMAGRDKVIVDAETIPGRRTLWLFDPTILKTPTPPVAPKEP